MRCNYYEEMHVSFAKRSSPVDVFAKPVSRIAHNILCCVRKRAKLAFDNAIRPFAQCNAATVLRPIDWTIGHYIFRCMVDGRAATSGIACCSRDYSHRLIITSGRPKATKSSCLIRYCRMTVAFTATAAHRRGRARAWSSSCELEPSSTVGSVCSANMVIVRFVCLIATVCLVHTK